MLLALSASLHQRKQRESESDHRSCRRNCRTAAMLARSVVHMDGQGGNGLRDFRIGSIRRLQIRSDRQMVVAWLESHDSGLAARREDVLIVRALRHIPCRVLYRSVPARAAVDHK